MTIKSFKGKLANGGQNTIVLHTNDGTTGYKIVKFEKKFTVFLPKIEPQKKICC